MESDVIYAPTTPSSFDSGSCVINGVQELSKNRKPSSKHLIKRKRTTSLPGPEGGTVSEAIDDDEHGEEGSGRKRGCAIGRHPSYRGMRHQSWGV
jgi:hypothetical protein